MTTKRMDNVGVLVADIDAAIEIFGELGPGSRVENANVNDHSESIL